MLQRPEVLAETFVPSDVVHRHDEISMLANALQPLEDGQPANDAFLFGPTGSGKTVTARYTLEQLETEAPEVRHALVDCWRNYSRRRCLQTILQELRPASVDVAENTPVDRLLSQVADAVSGPTVLVFDEADQLEDTRVLYDLYDLDHVSFVLIANRETELFAHMDSRVESRLSAGVSIYYDAYSHDELVSILSERAREAFEPLAVMREQIEEIADRAAGDARAAIKTLEQAGRLAESEGATQVTSEHVQRAAPKARESIRDDTVEQLTDHQRALYEALAEDGPLRMGALYERYERAVGDAKSKKTVRRRLKKMEHYDLVVIEGDRGGREYDVVE